MAFWTFFCELCVVCVCAFLDTDFNMFICVLERQRDLGVLHLYQLEEVFL